MGSKPPFECHSESFGNSDGRSIGLFNVPHDPINIVASECQIQESDVGKISKPLTLRVGQTHPDRSDPVV